MCIRDSWDGAALFARPDDPDHIGAAIQELINNPSKRQEFAARARARAMEFNPERMAAAYLSAYAEVMAPTRLPQGEKDLVCES